MTKENMNGGDTIKDINVRDLKEDISLDKNERSRIIHVVNPTLLSFGSCNPNPSIWDKIPTYCCCWE